MVWIPKFKIYSSTNVLQYTFQAVQSTNAPRDPQNHIIIEGQRGIGGVVIGAGKPVWDLTIESVLFTSGYQNLVTAMDAMETSIAKNTPYYLKIDKSPTVAYSYKVKRLDDFIWGDTNLRNDFIRVTTTFKANVW